MRTHLADKNDIILTGDFNDEIGNKYGDLTQMIEALGLIDIYSYRHGFESEVSTYNRGSTRLDYTFVKRRMVDHVEACGYDKYHEVISSDHRGFFLDLSIQGLFGGELPAIFTP